MKIALVGATGNVGSATLREAVAAGHEVVAFARRPDAVEKIDGVRVVEGALDDVAGLTSAITGSDVLVAAVTGPVRDKTFAQRTVPNLIAAVRDSGVGRLVLVSAFGAGDTALKASPFARALYRTALKGFFDDKAAAEELLPASGINWTAVYPVNLKAGQPVSEWAAEPIEKVKKVPGLPTLPYSNVAKTLVQLATDQGASGRRILVTTKSGWKAV